MAPDRKPTIPPAINGTEQRLDALLGRLDRLIALLEPQEPAPAPAAGEMELREPAKARGKKALKKEAGSADEAQND